VVSAALSHDELVTRARAVDHEAFCSLADVALPRLFNAARLILRDRDAADDAVQETLVRAWRDLPGLRDPARFDGWLYRLLTHACHDELRRRKRRSEGRIGEIPPGALSTRDETPAVATRELIERAFERLSPDHREVLVLVHYLGLPLAEAAATLGAPIGTVKSRLHYALSAIRAAIEADDRSDRSISIEART
jgi:RNA polymerase sigma-70 factor, ECF subfamily